MDDSTKKKGARSICGKIEKAQQLRHAEQRMKKKKPSVDPNYSVPGIEYLLLFIGFIVILLPAIAIDIGMDVADFFRKRFRRPKTMAT